LSPTEDGRGFSASEVPEETPPTPQTQQIKISPEPRVSDMSVAELRKAIAEALA